jgi:hypothetical protein
VNHPRRAARDPLKGAALAAGQSPIRGALGWRVFVRKVSRSGVATH